MYNYLRKPVEKVATIKGRIKAISVSKERGTQKTNVPKAELKTDFGIVGDAHSGNWHRQVSLLGIESIDKMIAKGEKLITDTVSSIKIDLYIDGKLSEGTRYSEIFPMSSITCGDYLDGAYWILNKATIEPLLPGEHEVRVVYTFLREITDGYDFNSDGKLDTYGPESSFYQQYTIVVNKP